MPLYAFFFTQFAEDTSTDCKLNWITKEIQCFFKKIIQHNILTFFDFGMFSFSEFHG
jgi:hypothetical protein